MTVKITQRLKIQAAAASVLLVSGLALGHAAAQTNPTASAQISNALPASGGEFVASQPVAAEPQAPRLDDRHVNCMAKVVHHEAGNQPLAGQIAVAQVLLNRVKRGFGDDVCEVANQPGQFFRLGRYHPDRKSARWAEAVDVARTVLAGEARDWSKGALFFHANWAKPNSFFRGRTKVVRLEDHDFYR